MQMVKLTCTEQQHYEAITVFENSKHLINATIFQNGIQNCVSKLIKPESFDIGVGW